MRGPVAGRKRPCASLEQVLDLAQFTRDHWLPSRSQLAGARGHSDAKRQWDNGARRACSHTHGAPTPAK
eukprot:2392843-Pyramimonas_sp.AAC.1